MDHYPSRSSSYFDPTPQGSIDQINNQSYAAPFDDTFRSPTEYSEWSLPSSAQPEMLNSFDGSLLSTYSQTTFGDDNGNPFELSFSKYPQYSQGDISNKQLSKDATQIPCEAWFAPPTSSMKPYFSPQQTSLSQQTSPRDSSFPFYKQEAPKQVDSSMLELRIPVAIAPSRKRGTSTKKSTKSEFVARDKRSTIRHHRQGGDLSQISSVPDARAQEFRRTNPSKQLGGNEPEELACRKPDVQNLDEDKERHKHVEMKYRTQMKDRFEELLRALPDQSNVLGGEGRTRQAELNKKMTRGKVLDLAKAHIDSLGLTRRALEKERDVLRYKVSLYEAAWLSMGHTVLDAQNEEISPQIANNTTEIELSDRIAPKHQGHSLQ